MVFGKIQLKKSNVTLKSILKFNTIFIVILWKQSLSIYNFLWEKLLKSSRLEQTSFDTTSTNRQKPNSDKLFISQWMRNQCRACQKAAPLEAAPLARIPNTLAHPFAPTRSCLFSGHGRWTGPGSGSLVLGLVRFVCSSPQTVNLFATHAAAAAAVAAAMAAASIRKWRLCTF